MKKLLTIIALVVTLAVPVLVQAQTWHSTNQVTLAWDAVSMPVGTDGNPLPGSVAYDVYSVVSTAEKTTAKLLKRVTTNEAVVSFDTEGKYYLGVRSVRVISPTEENASDIVWSDNPAVVSGGVTFGVAYYISLPAPGGLRLPQ